MTSKRKPPEGPVLTALAETDAEALHRWRNDPVVRDGALGYPFPTSIASELEWIRSFAPRGTPADLCLAVRQQAGGPALGYVQLRGIDWIARCAELGIVIGEADARGHGLGRAALTLAIGYAFDQLDLRRLWLRVVDYNAAAIKLYRGQGFIEEGVLRGHVFRQRRYCDVLILGLAREDLQRSVATLPSPA